MKEFKIKFRTEKIDSEEIRECIEDNLGVEILEIEEVLLEKKDEIKEIVVEKIKQIKEKEEDVNLSKV